jgi:Tol biopolymer transport system component
VPHPATRLTSFSPDLQSVAYFYPGDDGRYDVWISSPPTAAPKRYLPDPYASKDIYNAPKLKFSPDGKWILLLMNGGRGREEAWLMPYPADPSRPPRPVFPDLRSNVGTPSFCWMPDSRRVLLALSAAGSEPGQLWIADTVSGERHALTSGTTARSFPAVSPDGGRVIFGESTGSYDIVSLDLATAQVHPLIATDRDELMPSWAGRKPVMAYVTDRNGPQEIWLREAGGSDRPLVTARDFPPGTLQWLMGPALSPEGDRVVYTKVDAGGAVNRLWISAAAGGAPVPLTNDRASTEYPGSWSMDGSWFAYVAYREGAANLMRVKTGGQATPVVVRQDASYDNEGVPVWSPDGEWIALGETLYSADGKTARSLGDHRSEGYVFAPDGKRLYGLRSAGEGEELFWVDAATGAEKTAGAVGGYRPRSNVKPAIRLSLAPDGKSLAYGVAKFKDNLWMLDGFAAKTGLLARWGL